MPDTDDHKTLPTQPRALESVRRWDIEADVVVVGLGGAGATAAIEAADAGAETVALEVASAGGGTTALSSAEIYMGGNGGTPAQRANGFDDSVENMTNYLMLASGENADAEKVRAYAEGSRAHYDWLVSIGMPYRDSFVPDKIIIHETDDCLLFTGSEEAYPFNAQATPCPRGHKPAVVGDNGGPLLVGKLLEQVKRRERIRVICDARALTLIQDADRRVHGVVARIDMQERCVRARRGVALCAGGFAMNRGMIAKHVPEMLRNPERNAIGNPYDDGSGIRMGLGAGGAAINMGGCFTSLPFYPPSGFVKGILVNAQGQRFINEDCYHGRIGHFCMRQRDDAIYLVLDNELFDKPNEYTGMQLAGSGETIADLEAEIGLVPETLQHTVSVFNRFAERREDPLFNKSAKYLKALNQPPYAAFDCSIGQLYYPYFTLGGLDTKPSGEVLNADGRVIPGLYAAGRTSCGLPRSGSGYSSGMSVGDATFFGRLAGRAAATG